MSARTLAMSVLLGSCFALAATPANAASITFTFDNSGILVDPLTTNSVPLTGELRVTLTDVSDTTNGPGGIPETTDTTNILFTIENGTNADLYRLRFNYDPFLSGAYAIRAGTGPQPSVLYFGSDQSFNYGVFDLSFGIGVGPHSALGSTSTFTLDVNSPLSALRFIYPTIAQLNSFDCTTSGDTNCGNALVAAQPVPEPSTLVLLGIGALGSAARLRRRRN